MFSAAVEAAYFLGAWIATACGLAMTNEAVIARNAVTWQSTGCHCEERSDAAIQDVRVHGSPRYARDDE